MITAAAMRTRNVKRFVRVRMVITMASSFQVRFLFRLSKSAISSYGRIDRPQECIGNLVTDSWSHDILEGGATCSQ